ncbi:proline-rich protein [Collybia nuda]|uniref:Proline-rich protein n=1 Tax=Collybia nuda TaxID=64659 RepID=A0A9P5YDJ7_9AGAR|nr:proline-rich protein [Collybia nuda]
MWTLTGPFDGEVVGELGFQKTKLLKTSMTYPLGRKGTGLVISSKKISSHHCDFVVGLYTINDVSDPGKKPTLEFVNKKDKGMRISRGETEYPVNPSTTRELEDGDIVAVISGVLITVQWTPVCCYTQALRGKSTVPLDSCASLGINVVLTPSLYVTHHLTPNYAANPVMAASLLSACQFVRPEWIMEVIRLGNLPPNNDPSDGVSLEQTFVLPLASKYRPIFSPSLQPLQKTFNVWEPNEERLNMFSKYRFLWVDEKMRELDGNFKDIIERGGGSYEMFDVHGGTAKLHRALTRGQAKEGKKQLVVGKENSIQAAVGKGGWKELLDEIKTFGLHLIEPDTIIQVVVDVDPSLFDVPPSSGTNMDIDEVGGISSPLPSFIPNTHPDEPSVPPPEPEYKSGPPRRLTRRVTSRQASQEPMSDFKSPELSTEVDMPRPRRALTRRVNAGIPVVTGLDDPSSIMDVIPELSAPRSTSIPPPPVLDLTAPTPMRSTKLKRRLVGGVASGSLDPGIFALSIEESVEEPPLKKFKALFDASHPDKMGAGSFDDTALEEIQSATLGASTDTQTQSQTQEGRGRQLRGSATTNLSVLREEEEETPSSAMGHTIERGTKRAYVDIHEDVELEGFGDRNGLMTVKRRAIENRNAVDRLDDRTAKPTSTSAGSKPPSTAITSKSIKPGAPPGQPDKDAAFLKAIASTKRGKKAEDEFDRDFNKLKISKPDLVREEPEKEWAILEDFGDETNVRGNFMVVVEMEIPDNTGRQRRVFNEVQEWQGKPNFKKFKKGTNFPKAAVELVLSEENDYGMGPAYWKGGNSQPVQRDLTMKEKNGSLGREPAPSFAHGKTQAMVMNDSDEEVAPRKGKNKPRSRAGSAASSNKTSTRNSRLKKSQPLFLDSDDDVGIPEEEDEAVGSDDDVLTLRSNAGTNVRSKRTTHAPTRAAKKPVPILVDDDSDDGAVFKGFTGKTRRAR